MLRDSGIRTFVTTVTAIEQVAARMIQITCGGGDLVEFQPLGPDTFVYVLAPPAGLAELTIDRSFTWSAYGEMPWARRPVGAYYTVRRWRPERAEVDLVVVLHDRLGEGASWARRARPGDPVALWGPRDVFEPPPGTDSFLLVGDETGVHAIAAILETLSCRTRVQVVVESSGPADHVALAIGSNTTVVWVDRLSADADGTSPLLAAVRALDLDLGSGSIYAWGGAESHVMAAIRRYLRDEVGLEASAVAMTAYWRRCGSTDEP